MAEKKCEDFYSEEDDFDFEVKIKQTRNRSRKSRRNPEKNSSVDDNKSNLLENLVELEIPSLSKALLTKLINNGQLTSIGKVLHRSMKSIILSGKVNKTHRNFPLLSSDDVIIKIHINGEKDELWKRAEDESKRLKSVVEGVNQPTFLLHSGNIVVMTLIGTKDLPAQNVHEVLMSTARKIELVYFEVLQFWCHDRERTFDPLSFLYHENKWWSVGHQVRPGLKYSSDEEQLKTLIYYRSNLKHLIDLFLRHGLTLAKADEGFLKLHCVYWCTQSSMRGRRSFDSLFTYMYTQEAIK